jgi:ABC-type multidrug transport system fused ATPase/permease subunit
VACVCRAVSGSGSASRALLAGPEFLVLDEGTAQLDLGTERRLFAALRVERQPLTVLVVIHRPQTAALCDRTIDLDRHLVVGAGTRRLEEERKVEVA